MGDPVIIAIVAGAGVVIVLSILGRIWQTLRGSGRSHLGSQVRSIQKTMEARRRQLEQLSLKIETTSSTATIAGYEIVRQIEAVFTEGHPTPPAAVIALKAEAAIRGANAIVNLTTVRPPSGKCTAQGDAVVVRPKPSDEIDAIIYPAAPTPPIEPEPPHPPRIPPKKSAPLLPPPDDGKD